MTGKGEQSGTLWRRNVKKTLSAVISILLIFSIALWVYVLYCVQTKEYVTIFGGNVFQIVSGSMEPQIPVGSLIVSQQSKMEEIQVGDVVVFRSAEPWMYRRVVLHRVVDISQINGETVLITQGDANPVADPRYVTRENLIGKMICCATEKHPIAGLYRLLTHKVGFCFLVIVPGVVLVGALLCDDLTQLKQMRGQSQKDRAQR